VLRNVSYSVLNNINLEIIIMPPKYALMQLANFPNHRMFQFFVDGSMHANEAGESGFENREPGCMSAFYNAFNFALENLDKELNLELIFKIHELVSENVSGDFGIQRPGEFRDTSMKPFRIPYERFTAAGIISYMTAAAETEIGKLTGYSRRGHSLNFKLKDKFALELVADKAIEPNVSFSPPFQNKANIQARATYLLNQFKDDLTKAKAKGNNDNIIKAIVHFIRYMELLHPFGDANGRVFVNIVLNFLLMQNNFLPVTLYEPNIFDLYSDDELVDAIKDGMSHTLYTIKNPTQPLFGYTAPTDYNESIERIKETITSFIDSKIDISTDMYVSELESLCDTAWDKKFNLHRFCATGEIEKIKNFPAEELKSKCTIIAPDSVAPLYKGLAPLHIACKMNKPDIVSFLIRVNQNTVNQKDHDGNTPIYYAIQTKNSSLIQFLLENGAELNVSNSKSESPLNWAAKYLDPITFNKILFHSKSLQISELNNNAKLELIQIAATHDNLDLLQWIITKQHINLQELMEILSEEFGDYNCPISMALKEKAIKSFQFLLSQVFLNKKMPFSIFENYLSEIVKSNNYSLLEFTLAHTDLSSKTKPIEFDILTEALIKERRDFLIPYKLIELEPDIATIPQFQESCRL